MVDGDNSQGTGAPRANRCLKVISRIRPDRSVARDPSKLREDRGAPLEDKKETDCSQLTMSRIRLLEAVRNNEKGVDFSSSSSISPLQSSFKFEDLRIRKEFLKALYRMGFQSPSRIQGAALANLMAEPPMNMIAQSQSGTGKTATFLVASLSRIDENLKHPQVLILCPTFELARQTATVAEALLRYSPGIRVQHVVRGQVLPLGSRIRAQVVIGTPGKMLDWALKYRFFDISEIRVFVFDEADIMIDEAGHRDQSIRLHEKLSAGCQMMLFSATYGHEVTDFANTIIPEPCVKITLKREEEFLENIVQYVMLCPDDDSKQRALENIYCSLSVGQALIFCRTKAAARKISDTMRKLGQNVAVLTGDHRTSERVTIIDRFREGYEKVLITTNLCARGLDIEQVSLVINFDLPVNQDGNPDFEAYLHRVGRTGRFGRAGVAMDFVNPNYDRDMINIQKIKERFQREMTFVDFKDFDALESMNTEN